jgi:hypothetical protein
MSKCTTKLHAWENIQRRKYPKHHTKMPFQDIQYRTTMPFKKKKNTNQEEVG